MGALLSARVADFGELAVCVLLFVVAGDATAAYVETVHILVQISSNAAIGFLVSLRRHPSLYGMDAKKECSISV